MAEPLPCLQEKFAPRNVCFGCGHANPRGLRIRSFPESRDPWDAVVMEWMPEPHHEAFDQIVTATGPPFGT